MRKDGKTMIRLVSAGGTHADSASATDDYIPPVLDIRLALSLPGIPKKIILQPEGRELPFSCGQDGRISVCVDRVNVHSALEICE